MSHNTPYNKTTEEHASELAKYYKDVQEKHLKEKKDEDRRKDDEQD